MSQTEPCVLGFMNEYRKELSLIKIRSFYTNHMCKKKCLQGNLYKDNTHCVKECDRWLDIFFQLKSSSKPKKADEVLFANAPLTEKQRAQYEKDCATTKLELNQYTNNLRKYIQKKIQQLK